MFPVNENILKIRNIHENFLEGSKFSRIYASIKLLFLLLSETIVFLDFQNNFYL